MSEHDEPGFDCILAFDADGEFARGFEAGRIWTMLQDTDNHPEMIGQPLHATNAEMLIRMAEALQLIIAAEPQDETWIAISQLETASTEGEGQ